ncbi:class I SAM-dependent methyltransferase [Lawsonia intracellularis]|uniref:Methyltransferase 24 n=2 Tax=Lawsonia intracellularis TaxID=29546 RepID=Q1MNX3_LAWIP|nr:class I SAM-dependent methyltransferase [Lawsonia intracellularis]AGC50681.1 methyltransferase [Lawsonia intracellularis N343]KAA0204112.1 class I SAM-dependent methyltransferase [Lawsonia intracellularis]MBZ3893278.1 class I SAM-dependent methyltransferase [Lawsonia intracellularis]OMQ01594.1 methyltransferase [Lawsonia intracellularis]RBN31924.1 class I SAM-dependent methyltransferase [Lawsonia intracellularis]
MSSNTSKKWPKVIPPLTPEQEAISLDFYHYWLELLASKYNMLEKFNHGYVVKAATPGFCHTLEIGAGIGEHLYYENLSEEQTKNYVAVDVRESFIEKIRNIHPQIKVLCGDCQDRLPFEDGHFDRIIAIHVLEHLPNLPAAIREIHRLCNKQSGSFSIVIPCEGSLAYSFARMISTKRIFKKRYNQSYDWFIKREHINTPSEIFEEIAPYFKKESTNYFPLFVPLAFCNLIIGATFSPIIHNN